MALLTASQDSLLYDPLRDQDGEVDPLSPKSSKRIQIMDDDLGFAVHPEEKSGIEAFKREVDAEVGRLKGQRSKYQKQYSSAMSAADQQASGILGQYRGVPSQQTVKVNIVGKNGVEGTYTVNRDWAQENLGKVNASPAGNGSFNVSVNQQGRTVGQELHEAFADVHGQTTVGDRQIGRANAAVDKARSGTAAEIASQKAIAEQGYNQSMSQFDRAIKETKAVYTRYITDQQKAFQTGIETNTGGIRNLLDSGALVMKGDIS